MTVRTLAIITFIAAMLCALNIFVALARGELPEGMHLATQQRTFYGPEIYGPPHDDSVTTRHINGVKNVWIDGKWYPIQEDTLWNPSTSAAGRWLDSVARTDNLKRKFIPCKPIKNDSLESENKIKDDFDSFKRKK
jgi:hypothetical protein